MTQLQPTREQKTAGFANRLPDFPLSSSSEVPVGLHSSLRSRGNCEVTFHTGGLLGSSGFIASKFSLSKLAKEGDEATGLTWAARIGYTAVSGRYLLEIGV